LLKYRNDTFERGAPAWKEFVWLFIQQFLFRIECLKNYTLKNFILNRLGADVEIGVVFKPKAKITFPWKLSIGANSWIGEEVWLLNLDQITIGSNVCISQRAFLCTGNHDWSKSSFDLIVKPITIEDGVWICANVLVGPGVTVGKNSVIKVGSVVTQDLPPNMICEGNPCLPVEPRIVV